jgi:hypothetical protein
VDGDGSMTAAMPVRSMGYEDIPRVRLSASNLARRLQIVEVAEQL